MAADHYAPPVRAGGPSVRAWAYLIAGSVLIILGVLLPGREAGQLSTVRAFLLGGGLIALSAAVDDGQVRVDVADRGLGLVPGEEERVFDKFYRSPRSRSSSGVGLGLTICRGMVELHGGRIWAANQPDGGACFSFTLPRGEAPPVVRADGPA